MTINKLGIDCVNLNDKRVVIRVDFNCPLKDDQIVSNHRIVVGLDSVKYALEQQARSVIILSHLDHPNGVRNLKLTLRPIADEIQRLLKREVIFLPDCIGPEIEAACFNSPKGSLILLENLRFHAEEEGYIIDESGKKIAANPGDVKKFRQALQRLGDIYVNDAFATAHKSHSSMLGEGFRIRAAGFLMQKEIRFFSKALDNPERPFIGIMGGARVMDKIDIIDNILEKVSELVIGGAMAFPFLKETKNTEVGHYECDSESLKIAKKLLEKANSRGVTIHLPIDFVISNKFADDGDVRVVDISSGIPATWYGMDIGPDSIALFREPIARAKIILWNGPMGVFEFDKFSKGSREIMNAVTEATDKGATSIIGGGHTASCASLWKAASKLSHVSTGGGASLKMLEGKGLPAVEALSPSVS